MSVIVTIFRRC